jgi:hypothetical protein
MSAVHREREKTPAKTGVKEGIGFMNGPERS